MSEQGMITNLLDDAGVPLVSKAGDEFSTYGRICWLLDEMDKFKTALRAAIDALEFAQEHYFPGESDAAAVWAHCNGYEGNPDIRKLAAQAAPQEVGGGCREKCECGQEAAIHIVTGICMGCGGHK